MVQNSDKYDSNDGTHDDSNDNTETPGFSSLALRTPWRNGTLREVPTPLQAGKDGPYTLAYG